MATPNLKNYSVAQLLTMRSDIDRTLVARRSELEAQLAEIGGGRASSGKGRRKAIGKVAAKYRHPETGETWSGRGGVAGWLARELKAGKSREDFLVDGESEGRAKKASTGAPKRRGRPPGRKSKKAAAE